MIPLLAHSEAKYPLHESTYMLQATRGVFPSMDRVAFSHHGWIRGPLSPVVMGGNPRVGGGTSIHKKVKD